MKTTTAEKLHKTGKLIIGNFYVLKFTEYTEKFQYHGLHPFLYIEEKDGVKKVKEELLFKFYSPYTKIEHKNFGDAINIVLD